MLSFFLLGSFCFGLVFWGEGGWFFGFVSFFLIFFSFSSQGILPAFHTALNGWRKENQVQIWSSDSYSAALLRTCCSGLACSQRCAPKNDKIWSRMWGVCGTSTGGDVCWSLQGSTWGILASGFPAGVGGTVGGVWSKEGKGEKKFFPSYGKNLILA